MFGFALVSLWQASAVGPLVACPSGEAVAAQLDRLGTSAAVAKVGTPSVTTEGNRMRVSLRGLDGLVTGMREVVAPDDCQERAMFATALIFAWVGAWQTGAFLDGTKPSSSGPLGAMPTIARAAEATRSDPAASVAPATAASAPVPVFPQSAATVSAPSGANPPAIAALIQPAPSLRGSAMGLALAGYFFGTHDGDAGALGSGLEIGFLRLCSVERVPPRQVPSPSPSQGLRMSCSLAACV